jgi:hypothetical protein
MIACFTGGTACEQMLLNSVSILLGVKTSDIPDNLVVNLVLRLSVLLEPKILEDIILALGVTGAEFFILG